MRGRHGGAGRDSDAVVTLGMRHVVWCVVGVVGRVVGRPLICRRVLSSTRSRDQILTQTRTRGERYGQIRTGEDVPLGWKVEAPPFLPIPFLLVVDIACGRVVVVDVVTSGHAVTRCHRRLPREQQCSRGLY